MLINAKESQEQRVALVDGQDLYDLDIELIDRAPRTSNIYKATIKTIEESLEASFIDYGSLRHGFLPLRDIQKSYPKKEIKVGMELLVQMDKEERGNKGAAMTSQISLAGRYLVLMPTVSKAGGISKRIVGPARDQLKSHIEKLNVPDQMSVIARTNAEGKSALELKWDFEYLTSLWEMVEKAFKDYPSPTLIHKDSNLILRSVRDNLTDDIGEVLIDEKRTYEEVKEYVKSVMPSHNNKIKFYDSDTAIFSRYQVESQVESAFSRFVHLKAGGSIVIDHTEAMTTIDVNSARSNKRDNIEETALHTNIEAAKEIARQMRIRDMGGLIVIDFIDIDQLNNRRKVEQVMRDELTRDRARVQMTKISELGLMEISRQRLRPSLLESSEITCPRCEGRGSIRENESLALSILRMVSQETVKPNTTKVEVLVPIEIASYLLNEKRDEVTNLQETSGVTLFIIPSLALETPHYEIKRYKEGENGDELVKKQLPTVKPAEKRDGRGTEVPVITTIAPKKRSKVVVYLARFFKK